MIPVRLGGGAAVMDGGWSICLRLSAIQDVEAVAVYGLNEFTRARIDPIGRICPCWAEHQSLPW